MNSLFNLNFFKHKLYVFCGPCPSSLWSCNFIDENILSWDCAGFFRISVDDKRFFVNKRTLFATVALKVNSSSLSFSTRYFSPTNYISAFSRTVPIVLGHNGLLTKIIKSCFTWMAIKRHQASTEPSYHFRQQDQAAPEVPLSFSSNCAVPYQFLLYVDCSLLW